MNNTIHDLYFSQINYDHIYRILTSLIYEETNYNIKDIYKYQTIYKTNYSKLFNDNDTDDISVLNKLLIDNIGKIILQDINNNNNISNKSKKVYDILKYKSIMIDKQEYICIKIKEIHDIKPNTKLDLYDNKTYLNSQICDKILDNYIFIKANNFNTKSNKIIY